ncbi:fasciclin domain-containing protein [Pontibacter beigongshangensis]|uniref:fasciclin domain-containing protein n=1 Tax=Pontibacter beigongshangensis TaxID=2574733 RepID=UPI00164FE1CB|nr:fasciclin domain-containing protein [Pontibacter beigongshangensis]
MKKYINCKQRFILAACALLLSSCDFAGLEFQKDDKYHYEVLDPKINMSAWDYINQPRADTLFNMAIQGVKYAGLEEEYKKQGRTFIIPTWTTFKRVNTSNGTLNSAAYFYKRKPDGTNATGWKDIPVETVRKFFLYHIVDGEYSFDELTPDNTVVTTLLDEADNKMTLRVLNDRNSRIEVNNYLNTKRTSSIRTSNLQVTNGVVHVTDNYYEPGVK